MQTQDDDLIMYLRVQFWAEEGMALLEKAAGQGHAYAMSTMGCIHNVRKEHEQAVEWFTKGAEAGLPQAMFNLGRVLDTTEGMGAPDYPAVLDWYRRAADTGDGDAAHNLCTMLAAAGPGRKCLSRHLPRFRRSLLENFITTRRGEHCLPGRRARGHA
jgi:TPR repeat protein